jgi:hypothetical protein
MSSQATREKKTIDYRGSVPVEFGVAIDFTIPFFPHPLIGKGKGCGREIASIAHFDELSL